MKTAKSSSTIDRRGDVWLKRAVRHQDGTISLRRKRVGCGIPDVAHQSKEICAILLSRPQPAPKAPEPVVETSPAKPVGKRGRPKKEKLEPRVITERLNERATEFDGKNYIETMRPAYVSTTSKINKRLRQFGARMGDHVDYFLRDVEAATSALRSPDMGAVKGGNGKVPIPMAQIQAQDRVRSFGEKHPESFLVCKVLLVHNRDPKEIPIPADLKKHGGRRKLIQQSLDDLAGFYTPSRRRPNRALLDFAKMIEAESG